MYTIDKAGRIRHNGKLFAKSKLPTSRKFDTPAGPCVIVAKTLEEQIDLANAETPEDIEGYTEALALVRK